MEQKKEKDEAEQVEGRENFDYTVQRRRKKVKTIKASDQEENNVDLKALEKSGPKAEPEVLEWIK